MKDSGAAGGSAQVISCAFLSRQDSDMPTAPTLPVTLHNSRTSNKNMHTRTLPWPLADVCWNCQWRITSQRRKLALLSGPRQGTTSVSRPRVVRRAFHATELVCLSPFLLILQHSNIPQCSQIEPSTPANSPQAINPAILDATRPVRQRLKLWQEELGGPNAEELRAFENYLNRDEISNGMNNLNLGAKSDEGYRAGEREEDPDDEGEDLITIGLFLKPGDVVEISYVIQVQPARHMI